jgi:hypothetical protein
MLSAVSGNAQRSGTPGNVLVAFAAEPWRRTNREKQAKRLQDQAGGVDEARPIKRPQK